MLLAKIVRYLLSLCLGCFALAQTHATAQNLVTNPGGEDESDAAPAGWHLYVEPQAGSVGARVDSIAHEGHWSLMLCNATAYAAEPANNWSQNLLLPLARKTLHVSGFIKSEDATYAAIWVQCFRKQPWAVLLQRSTIDTNPISGTRDWTPVEMDVAVPSETDFVVVRCVLKGTGTAWFDDIQIAAKEVPAALDTPVAEKPVKMPEAPVMPVPPTAPSVPGSTSLGGNPSRDDIIATQSALREANEALRQSNQALADQLNAMRQQLQELREEIRGVEAAEKKGNEGSATKSAPEPVPPLVPRLPEKRREIP